MSNAQTLADKNNYGRNPSVETRNFKDWRYTRWSDGKAERYDHQVDPEETHDVAGDPAHADLIRRLGSLLDTRPAMRLIELAHHHRPSVRSGRFRRIQS